MVIRPQYSIGELVERTGVPATTIHHYRHLGLLPPPDAIAANRFAYDERHVQALRLIRLLRERRHLSLETIRDVLPELLAVDEEAFRPEMWEQVVASHGDTQAAPTGVVAPSAAAQKAVDTALAQVGDPYVWGASGPDAFDCSGLTQYAYSAGGVSLPHSASSQSRMGTPVSRDQLQPGDLVFFYSPVSHVGMYIGNGQMVHAATSGEPVKVVSLDSMGSYNSARRVA